MMKISGYHYDPNNIESIIKLSIARAPGRRALLIEHVLLDRMLNGDSHPITGSNCNCRNVR